MAAKKGAEIISSFTRFLKPPWKITGPASTSEYKTHLPRADQYRALLPGEPQQQLAVPWADSDKIYDIKYYGRDVRRRHNSVLGGKTMRGVVDLATINATTTYNLPDPNDAEKVAALAAQTGESTESTKYTLEEYKAWAEGMPPLPGHRPVTMSGYGFLRKNILDDPNNGYE
mmetsp:Transcript_27381/g.52141  ORF Transcript_27381/g.52141 Transcript_27381/m.52141 type:complete len:172 (+) Transcript_27381:50-565(+)|eukprot:CAMPEP_0114237986 /NCGR_PEP_ID=MMETSP0058-20121206/7687_1 /TAXON_ID=36894 /ORGANISM="Pyramimonas parkeae, CCMP726" /LENGTH=171 /DNA_ID=CAMNT_0001350073 /DNA_START=50 /DNA_END=565 /DNA_ORIENTATION=-